MEIGRIGCVFWSGRGVVGRIWVRRVWRGRVMRDAMRVRGSGILLYCLFEVLYAEMLSRIGDKVASI